jgi:NTE family protein
MPNNQLERAAPVQIIETGSDHDQPNTPETGIALCLSGGGYRAMLFHLGALWRLNELGFLQRLDRISSVSGGSITAGVLALAWQKLSFDAKGVAASFVQQVVGPLRTLASRTIDAGAVIGGLLLPGSISDRVTEAYRKNLFGTATLQDLPDKPLFIFNATSVQSGALFRFSKQYGADYRVGIIRRPTFQLADAVAASAAFPPVLSPHRLELDPKIWDPPSGKKSEDLHSGAYLMHVVLTDGGVYDNLGLETAWKAYRTILVSDGGGKMQGQEEPHADWVQHGLRVNEIIDNQVRSLRKRQLIGSYELPSTDPLYREGTYLGIRSDMANYVVKGNLTCPNDQTMKLAGVATRLARLDDVTQDRLINWGYAICDAAMRKHVKDVQSAPPPPDFPYSASKVG